MVKFKINVTNTVFLKTFIMSQSDWCSWFMLTFLVPKWVFAGKKRAGLCCEKYLRFRLCHPNFLFFRLLGVFGLIDRLWFVRSPVGLSGTTYANAIVWGGVRTLNLWSLILRIRPWEYFMVPSCCLLRHPPRWCQVRWFSVLKPLALLFWPLLWDRFLGSLPPLGAGRRMVG